MIWAGDAGTMVECSRRCILPHKSKYAQKYEIVTVNLEEDELQLKSTRGQQRTQRALRSTLLSPGEEYRSTNV